MRRTVEEDEDNDDDIFGFDVVGFVFVFGTSSEEMSIVLSWQQIDLVLALAANQFGSEPISCQCSSLLQKGVNSKECKRYQLDGQLVSIG